MKRQVLLIQGGGDGAHAEDRALADYLQQALDSQFEVSYPKFAGLESIDYATWRLQAIDALQALGGGATVVAHSLGGAALLKVLAEDKPVLSIAALHLVATPYKCTDGEWGKDDFAIDAKFSDLLPDITYLALYHSRDDEWVPFSHLAQYAEKLPNAITLPLDGRGHSFMKQQFVELVDAIHSRTESAA